MRPRPQYIKDYEETPYIDANEQAIMFTKWLLFEKVRKDIHHNYELSHKGNISLNSIAISATEKAEIVLECIKNNYLIQWLNIENFNNVKDLIFFNNPLDYLKQFEQ